MIPQPLQDILDKAELPSFPRVDTSFHKWDILYSLWNSVYPTSPLKFSVVELPTGSHWFLDESLSSPIFQFSRSRLDYRRLTLKDDYGLVGLSMINPQDSTVVITEGVSDFLAMKLLLPHSNVLGFTNLAGSSRARRIISSLFTEVYYFSDSDSPGLSASSSLISFLTSQRIQCKVLLPPPPYKDFLEYFLFLYRSNV